ncbi:MAG: hypothetical protein RL335_1023 [Bacteroidota bacterium]
MKAIFIFLNLFLSNIVMAQLPAAPAAVSIPGVHIVSSKGAVTLLNGQKITYTTHTGYLDLKNDTDKTIAKLFFV